MSAEEPAPTTSECCVAREHLALSLSCIISSAAPVWILSTASNCSPATRSVVPLAIIRTECAISESCTTWSTAPSSQSSTFTWSIGPPMAQIEESFERVAEYTTSLAVCDQSFLTGYTWYITTRLSLPPTSSRSPSCVKFAAYTRSVRVNSAYASGCGRRSTGSLRPRLRWDSSYESREMNLRRPCRSLSIKRVPPKPSSSSSSLSGSESSSWTHKLAYT
mmetsp:Transcript_21566/g.49338  ORF Transcript_21566/g.49338 Transcript_21566/m.49338 type:complete len:220 (-) Transcript_21566:648-1307(-)